MLCTSPITRRIRVQDDFKASIIGRNPVLDVPCGQCIFCRLKRSTDFGVRMVMESYSHSEASTFFTLTYDDELMKGRKHDWKLSVEPKALSMFHHDLCDELDIDPHDRSSVRFFGVAEYGGKYSRPHYHVVIFGKNYFRDGSFADAVKRAWPWSSLSCYPELLVFENALYVAGYCVDKVTGKAHEDFYRGRTPPYMRNSKGMGLQYAKDNVDSLVKHGFRINGTRFALPRYIKDRVPRLYISEYNRTESLSEKELLAVYDAFNYKPRSGFITDYDSFIESGRSWSEWSRVQEYVNELRHSRLEKAERNQWRKGNRQGVFK